MTEFADHINITWSIEDVAELREDLTRQQCSIVLQYARDNHDANFGITWNRLNEICDKLYPLKGI